MVVVADPGVFLLVDPHLAELYITARCSLRDLKPEIPELATVIDIEYHLLMIGQGQGIVLAHINVLPGGAIVRALQFPTPRRDARITGAFVGHDNGILLDSHILRSFHDKPASLHQAIELGGGIAVDQFFAALAK